MSQFEIKLVIPLDMVERGIKAFKRWKDKRNEKESSQKASTQSSKASRQADGDGQDEDAEDGR